MSDTWTRTGGGTDTEGRAWAVGHDGPVVVVAVGTATMLRLDSDQRDEFMHAFADAEFAVERLAAGRDGMNQVERLARDLIGIPDSL